MSNTSSQAFSTHQSILMRPRKTGSVKNAENAEVEYQKEQSRLEARRNRFNDLYENRRVSLWGEEEEKKQLQEKRRHEIAHHLDIREASKKQEVLYDLQIANQYKQHDEVVKVVEQQNQIQKRTYLRSLMEDNMKLEQMRKQQQQAEREQEIQRERDQVEFFDRHRHYR